MAAKKKKKFGLKNLSLTAIAVIVLLGVILGLLYYFIPDTMRAAYYSWFAKEEPPILPDGEMQFHFIDVGQGDSILITAPDGKVALVDAGGDTDRDGNKADKEIIAYLNKVGVETIDYLILTHTDKDHVDYMDDVMDVFSVKKVFRPDLVNSRDIPENDRPPSGHVPTAVYDEFVKAIDEKGVDEHLNTGVVKLHEGLWSFDMYCYTPEMYDKVRYGNAKAINDVSPIGIISYGGVTVCLTGDAGESAEEYFIDTRVLPVNVDVLKVGHHGSDTATSSDFLNFIDPEYAVISVGAGNEYGHPHKSILDRLKAYRDINIQDGTDGIKDIYQTALKGDIVLSVKNDGNMKWIFGA